MSFTMLRQNKKTSQQIKQDIRPDKTKLVRIRFVGQTKQSQTDKWQWQIFIKQICKESFVYHLSSITLLVIHYSISHFLNEHHTIFLKCFNHSHLLVTMYTCHYSVDVTISAKWPTVKLWHQQNSDIYTLWPIKGYAWNISRKLYHVYLKGLRI